MELDGNLQRALRDETRERLEGCIREKMESLLTSEIGEAEWKQKHTQTHAWCLVSVELVCKSTVQHKQSSQICSPFIF